MGVRPFFIARIVAISAGIAIAVLAGEGKISWGWLVCLSLLYLSLLVLGAVNIRWNFFLRSLHHGPRDRKWLALTFDDGPAAATGRILRILKEEDVPAAFFTIGNRVDSSPQIVARWQAEGHLIGTHSYGHSFHFDWKSAGAMQEEIERAIATVQRITGQTPRLFRPPYGVTNPALARAVRRSGVYSIGWSLRSFDTRAKSGEALLKRLLARVRGGDVMLLHDSVEVTADILTAFIRACREQGFIFVRLDQMLGIDAYA